MRIRITAIDQPNYGSIILCDAAAAQALIIMGKAEAMPYTDFRDRLRNTPPGNNPGNTVPPKVPVGWSVIKKASHAGLEVYFLQESRESGELVIYDPNK